MTTSQTDLIAALRRPEAYPHAVSEVGVIQTHISLLFFAGDRVYKVKRPVDLGFLDFTTPEARRHDCEEEVRLNRRLASRTYLGVRPITREPDGLRIGGDGPVVEWAVEMVRLPAEGMLDGLLARGVIDNAALDGLVAMLADFHDTAATGPGVDEHGTRAAVEAKITRNLDELEPFRGDVRTGATLSPALLAHLRAWSSRFLADHATLMTRRVETGRIREGHGDLHSGNICLTDAGPVIYDCIEFSKPIRCADVASDLAFLAMDLDERGFRGFARYLTRTYADRVGDDELETLLPLYKMHMAAVRSKVSSIAAADAGLDDDARDRARRAAVRYIHLAAAETLPPVLAVTCGLPGSGKSHAARHLARPFEAIVLRSDVVRKRLAGVEPADRGDASIYDPAFTGRTYAALREDAGRGLDADRSVIVDATFDQATRRASFAALAAERGVPFILVHVRTAEDVIHARMTGRKDDVTEVSDAGWEVHLAARESFEVPSGEGEVEVDGAWDGEVVVSRCVDALVGRDG